MAGGRPRRHQGPAGLPVEAAEIEIGQATDDRLDGHSLQADLRSLGQSRRREPQRQRVSTSQSVDAVGVTLIDSGPPEEILGFIATKVLERKPSEESAQGARPTGHRRLPARQDDRTLSVRAGRNAWRSHGSRSRRARTCRARARPVHRVAQPRRGGLRGGQLTARLAFERGEEPSLGWLDRATVQSEYGRPGGPGLDAERLDECRLADAGDAMDEHDEGAVLSEHRRRTSISSLRPTRRPACSSSSWPTVWVMG